MSSRTETPPGVLVIGASVAGVRTVQALRARGYDGRITLLGEEIHRPYDKPPLSKASLADGQPVPLLSDDDLDATGALVRLGERAVALDPATHTVTTAAGDRVAYETLVIATGVTPRRLPESAGWPVGVFTVRTADDAREVGFRLGPTTRVVVVGAGFIGAEVASAARAAGADVTIVETQIVPMAHLFGPDVGAELGLLHAAHGTRVLAGSQVERLMADGNGHIAKVVLADGRRVPADLVVVGIGAAPATGWLLDSGLPVDDGIRCDEHLRVEGFPDVYAAGDVARWPHPLYDEAIRVEHWTNAHEHAELVAAEITGTARPAPVPPYVWSDQYGHRIQIVGRPGRGTSVRVLGGIEDRMVALYGDADDLVVGAVVVDDPRALMAARKAIGRRASVEAAAGDVLAKRKPAPGDTAVFRRAEPAAVPTRLVGSSSRTDRTPGLPR